MSSRKPGPEGFTWRGIKFLPRPDGAGLCDLYMSETVELAGGRSANWRVERQPCALAWHARLKIGPDRFPGIGKSHTAALHAAAAEAANVASFIVAMLPPGGRSSVELGAVAARRRPRDPRRRRAARTRKARA